MLHIWSQSLYSIAIGGWSVGGEVPPTLMRTPASDASLSIWRAEEQAWPVLLHVGLLLVGAQNHGERNSHQVSSQYEFLSKQEPSGKSIIYCCGLLEAVKVKSSTSGWQPAVSRPNQVERVKEQAGGRAFNGW
ncbi:unnamed protein product [Pleuronectes platessa]|uniref:Uncharacterized protein n=1 Tax=Pleuronectes platessa TaxID=8262 RepID=A0A9N7Y5V7_PLEPL|nr:unnamed protein product [Pleuronectes platessa]